MPLTPSLETSRLRLRQFAESDLDDYASMCADPEVMRYVGDRGPLSRDDTWRQLAMLVGHWALRGYGMWAVEELGSGAFVGRVGLHYPEGWPEPEIGWAIDNPQVQFALGPTILLKTTDGGNTWTVVPFPHS